MPSSALPLKVPSNSTPSRGQKPDTENRNERTPTSATKQSGSSNNGSIDISSPHELTAFVETLLEQLDTKFDDMSSQMLDRMTQMSARVDALEAAIQDIISGDIASNGSLPQSPSAGPATPGFRRNDNSFFGDSRS